MGKKRKISKGFIRSPRQLFLLAGVLAALLLVYVIAKDSTFLPWQKKSLTDKPNIIIVLTDDQRADTLDYMPIVKKELAEKGVTFTNAYATTPLCCPSRVSIYTGLYAHNTGIFTNHMPRNKANFPLGGFEAFGGSRQYADKDDETIAVWLKRAGYRTGFAGKYLNSYKSKYIPPGWDDWHGVVRNTYYGYDVFENGKIVSYGFAPKDYSTDVYTDKAIKFIKSTKQPFFFVVSTDAVHTDGGKAAPEETKQKRKKKAARQNKKNKAAKNKAKPVEADTVNDDPDEVKDYYAMPAPKDRETCIDEPWLLPTSFNEADVSDKPGYIQEISRFGSEDIEDITHFRNSQICTLKGVDRAIERITKALGSKRDNTVIIYIGDNGFSWGEHRLSKKNCLYEECAKVPLIISYPKMTSYAQINTSFVLNIDLASTIAELAGASIPVKVNGKSLTPLLTDPKSSVRSEFLLEAYNSRAGYKGIDYAIRTAEYKYTELSSGERELYDLQKDPSEIQNLIKDPQYVQTIQALANRLAKLKQE